MIRRLDGSAPAPLAGATRASSLSDGRATQFHDTIAQVAGANLEKHMVTPQALAAADDAWVEVVAVAEQLRDPALAQEKKPQLLKSLMENWRIFQDQSAPIARMLEEYAVYERAVNERAPS